MMPVGAAVAVALGAVVAEESFDPNPNILFIVLNPTTRVRATYARRE
jgi:hypothetical protein